MTQYISKFALVAEIERRIKNLNEMLIKHPISSPTLEKLIEENKKVLSLLDTLEVIEIGFDIGSSEGDKSAVKVVDSNDTFIEKAAAWLEEHKEAVETEDNGIMGWIPDYFIKDFKNYMKGE